MSGNLINIAAQSESSSIKTRLTSIELSLAAKIEKVDVPTSTTSTGIEGQIAFDVNYLYICVDTNTWRRVGLSTWGGGGLS